ncbi:MAG: tetratricopeptide repeat protein [Bacteroidales bacterium]|nr:tetratricopeptide repeat protein [Bacteroidales bacterium]MBN2632576.1 tetratricopeptide repeat protein [Bacteroidales bacterium]
MMIRKALLSLTVILLTLTVTGQSAYDILLKAKAMISEAKPEQAVTILSGFPGFASDSRMLNVMGEAQLSAGDIRGAIASYNDANRITAGSGEYGLARVYARAGDPATALYHLERSMRSKFRKSEKEVMLDPAFEKIENRPEWRQFWKTEWYTLPEMKIQEIEFYIKAGRTTEAGKQMADLERDYSGHETVLYGRALIEMASGRFSDAVASLSGLIATEPANEKYLRALAEAQTGASNHAAASSTYSKLIEMEVPDAGLLLLRASAYRMTGERQKAMADIERYLSIYPGSKKGLSLAGKTESTLGNNLKALEYFSENVKLHPNDPECYIDRADAYFLSRSWQWAINDYSMSLDLRPDNPEAWLGKGISLLNSGRKDDACHDFRKAFSMGNRKAVEYLGKYCME